MALYADQLLEPNDAAPYFATACRELYGVIHQRNERYGPEWGQFPDYVHEDGFYQVINAITSFDYHDKPSRFYCAPLSFAGHMWSWINNDLLKPPEAPRRQPAQLLSFFTRRP